jgi:hypothetical protein
MQFKFATVIISLGLSQLLALPQGGVNVNALNSGAMQPIAGARAGNVGAQANVQGGSGCRSGVVGNLVKGLIGGGCNNGRDGATIRL